MWRKMGVCRKCRKSIGVVYAYGDQPPDFDGPAKPPQERSRFLPGDPRKVADLIQRAGNGEELFPKNFDRVRRVNLN